VTWQALATPLIQKWEGFERRAYLCPAGVWTIGYGATGPDIGPGLIWTREEANERFARDLEHYGKQVDKLLKVPAEAHEKAALVSFAYNLGPAALGRSTLLRKFNAGDKEGAAREFGKWVYAGGKKLAGLVKRRAEETRMFQGA
jgi:lysozyme